MFVVIVTIMVKAGFEEQFKEAIITQARNSLELEEDCQRFDILQDPSEPRGFTLCEAYPNETVFNGVHRKTPHFASYAATTAPWVESKQLRTFTRIWPE